MLLSSLCRKLVALLAITFMVMTGLVGCNDSGTSDTAAQGNDEGDVVISLTDAPGDFSVYTVDVVSLTLTKANGATVSTLPLETRIDFTQYTEMTEFLTAATVPSGVYVSATLTLDYTNADIQVEDDAGNAIPVALENIVDENGEPVTQMEMTVQLEDRNRLLIAPGIPMHLLLDFDLNATNNVNLDDPAAPEITVDPFLVADVNRTPLKLHRVRGALNEVALDQGTFSLFLRPFYCRISNDHRHFGSRNITTTANTLYEINGDQYAGRAGLEAMASLDPLTAVIAIGDLKFNPLRYEARQVYAGSSVPGGTMDVVRGNVIAREGDTLTIKGATLIRDDSSVVFNDEVTVNIGDDTVVTRQLSADPVGTYGKNDISIGQRVMIFGTLDESMVMDATTSDSRVRMMLTTIRGTTTAVDDMAEMLTVDLQSIDIRTIGIFDFTGTNSDPDDYQVDTGSLNLSAIDIATPVKVRGFVEPFGAAPPDFKAQTVVAVKDLIALMKIHWNPATETAIESISMEALTLNLEGTGRAHHLFRGYVATDLTALEGPVVVAPASDDRGVFILRYIDGSFQVFLEFSSFAEALMIDQEEGHLVKKLHAAGNFDDASATLTTNYLEIRYGVNRGSAE